MVSGAVSEQERCGPPGLLSALGHRFGRISLIFGRECTGGFMVGESAPWSNRGIVRRTRRRRKERSLKMRTNGLVELFQTADHGVVHAVLDHLSAGVVLLDRKLNVLFANKAFRAMANDGVLALRGRTLSSSLAPYARKFDRMARMALLGAPGGTMAIPHPDDGRLITILVSSVQSRDLKSLANLTSPIVRRSCSCSTLPGRRSYRWNGSWTPTS
jgi:hypothetical protein